MAFDQNQGTDCFTRGHLLKVRERLAEKEKALKGSEKDHEQKRK